MKHLLIKVMILLGTLPFLSQICWAGIMEVGASASYRSSKIDAENFQNSFSTTGSISYYFWEMSALELSYTNGVSTVRIKPGTEPAYEIITGFQMIGVDFVLTFAGRGAPFQPFIKLGAAAMTKEIFREVEGQPKTELPGSDGTVPTAGIGFKIKLSKTFSIKVGVDAWISDDEKIEEIDSDNLDYAARAGISWIF